MTDANPTKTEMWPAIERAFGSVAKDHLIESEEGVSTDQTVRWSVYRMSDGLIRVDLKAAIGTFPADMQRDPREEP